MRGCSNRARTKPTDSVPQILVLSQPFPAEVCHEGPVLPEVGEDPSPRLQGGSPSWQGFRDLQVQPAFQGPPALNPGRHTGDGKGRSNAAFFMSAQGQPPAAGSWSLGRLPIC